MTTLHHTALSVASLDESIAWYADIFGLTVLSRQTIPHNGWKIAFIGNEDFILELIEVPGAAPLPEGRSHPDTDNTTLGVKHICLAVKDNVQFVQGLRGRGIEIVFEPPNMPSYCAFINDPIGNVIEIFDDSYDVSTSQS
jgi:methylmalonyl-CoA/ethylmalonyl-CoA epimerase